MARLPRAADTWTCDVADAAPLRAALAYASGADRIRRPAARCATTCRPGLPRSIGIPARVIGKPKVQKPSRPCATLLAAVCDQLRLGGRLRLDHRSARPGRSSRTASPTTDRPERKSLGEGAFRDAAATLSSGHCVRHRHGAARLAVVDAPAGPGLTPIQPYAGAAALLDLLGHADAPPPLLLTSRFPATPPWPLRAR